MCPLRRSSRAVYDLKYHFVWIPMYRKGIFVGEVAEYTREVFERIEEAYDLMIETVDVEEHHVHLFLEAPPKYCPADVAQILKSLSAREIFRRFPWLREQLRGGELWGDGYFVRSVGDEVAGEMIRRHIRYQQDQTEQCKLWASLLRVEYPPSTRGYSRQGFHRQNSPQMDRGFD